MGYGQEKSVEQNVEPLISDGTDVAYFIELLEDISDPRDNRGKIHELAFVLAVTTMAILSGKNRVSEIHRYIRNKIEWLQEIFDRPNAKPISRARLPRILNIVNWEELNAVIEEFFSVTVENINDEWIAIDEKFLGERSQTTIMPTKTNRLQSQSATKASRFSFKGRCRAQNRVKLPKSENYWRGPGYSGQK